MRYWNMARQRYCCGLARCWRALRLSADRAENAARKRALFGALIEESGSHMTRRWREMDSNPRSPVRRLTQTRSNGDVQHPCAAVGHARLAHPTIRDDDRSYPRSVIPGRDALACRDLVGLRRRTGDVIRFLWNGNGTLPALRPPLTRFSRG